MPKNPKKITRQSRKSIQRPVVLCEGECEKWYLESVLDSKNIKVEWKKHFQNPEKQLQYAKTLTQANENLKIYLMFDHDKDTTNKEQRQKLEKVNSEIKDNLNRIFSNPCFEAIFLFHDKSDVKLFKNFNEIKEHLNKILPIEYSKDKHCLEQLAEKLNFTQICTNSKKIYDTLKIDHTNWLDTNDNYSEVFRLGNYAIRQNHNINSPS